MHTMRISLIIAIVALTCCCTTTAVLQQKVVDRSGKKLAWAANMSEKDFVVTMGSGATQTDAQQQAMLTLKQEMARSVAENISSAGSFTRAEKNGAPSSEFSSIINSKVSKIAAIQGVSLSNAEVYWEKLQDKKTKEQSFCYYVKYPFSAGELSRLVAEYRREDKKLTDRLNELELNIDRVGSVEDITAAIAELTAMEAGFEDKRADRAQQLASRYASLHSAIRVVEKSNEPGAITYALQIGERPVTTQQAPSMKSSCATKMAVHGTSEILLTYDHDGCYDDVENWLTVSYRFGSATCSKKFYIDLSEGRLKLKVVAPIVLQQVEKRCIAKLTLDATYTTSFVVESMELNLLGQQKVMLSDQSDAELCGRGNHTIAISFNSDLIDLRSQGLASGALHLLNKDTGERSTISFSSVWYVAVR